MDLIMLNGLLDGYVEVTTLREHSKASEKYADVIINQKDGFKWKGSIPYFYRRTGLFIETEAELANYLLEIMEYFTKEKMSEFQSLEKDRWQNEMAGKETTKGFFDVLLNLRWNSVDEDFPSNPNWARRIQDIKEFGYTLATNTNMKIKGSEKNGTHIQLLPIPKGGITGYETMSASFKGKVIQVLQAINSYELRANNKHGLLPDHKFPEIRWDENTKDENDETMSDDEIKNKFQLIDNQRNQQKREVCRKCFQTNKRGIIFGIEFYYSGDVDWPENVPKTGKDAERGCLGCGWYDIQEWRKSLNLLLSKIK